MDTPEKTVIEINGVKLEVDLRNARRIDNIQVGSKVKVLTKKYDGHAVHHGVVVGFDPFKMLPTIVIAYMEVGYSSTGPEIKFLYYNTGSKEVEIVVARDDDDAAIDKVDIVGRLEKAIELKRNEISELEDRKNYFLKKFQSYWETPVEQNASVA